MSNTVENVVIEIISKPSRTYTHFVERSALLEHLHKQDPIIFSHDHVTGKICELLRDSAFCNTWGTWVYAQFDETYNVFFRLHHNGVVAEDLIAGGRGTATLHFFKENLEVSNSEQESPSELGQKLRARRTSIGWAQTKLATALTTVLGRPISGVDISCLERDTKSKRITINEALENFDAAVNTGL